MIIRRTISFDYLGEEYKDAYGVFASIPISEFPTISNTIDKEKDGVKKNIMMQDLVKEKFITGKFPNEAGELVELKKDDIDLDVESLSIIYNRLMGGADPKALMQSESSSTPTTE